MNYIAEINAFMDSLPISRLSAGQQALWLCLMHTANRCSWQEWLSIPSQTLQLYTGLSRKGVEKARNILKQKGYIDFRTNGTKATTYKLIAKSTQDSTQVGTQDSTQVSAVFGTQVGTQVSATYINKTKLNETKQLSKENKQRKFAAEVVDYLNNKLGTHYKASSKSTISHINARVAEGFTLEDFKTVIEKKVAEWKGTKLEQYLRPETLFGTKFENYLNANIVKDETKTEKVKKSKFQNFTESREYDIDDFEEKMLKRRGLG